MTDTCFCDAKPRRDPTGTADLRRRYGSALESRWRRVATLVRRAVQTEDVLALRPETVSPFLPDGRTHMFQHWLDQLMARVVLEDGAWLRPVIAVAYNRAVTRAMRLSGRQLVPGDATEVIDALWRMTVVEIQGVMEAVSQRLVRDAGNAMLHSVKPAAAARAMADGAQKVGAVRSRAAVEVMVAKSFTQGTIDQFRIARVTHVGVVPETLPRIHDARSPSGTGPGSRIRGRRPSLSTIYRIRRAQQKLRSLGEVDIETAGDDDVCPICEDLAAMGPYTIDEAQSLIPAHPWCRCAFVPAGDSTEEDSDWREELHPRGEGGQFIVTAGGSPEEIAAEMARVQREALRKVREKMAAKQKGEAFDGDWKEGDHPRVPAGSAAGGEFVGNNSGTELKVSLSGKKLGPFPIADAETLTAWRKAIADKLASGELSADHTTWPLVVVHTGWLVATQDNLDKKAVAEYKRQIETEKEGFAAIERTNGYRIGNKILIEDGHHRLIAAYQAGLRTIKMHVFDLTPKK